MTDEKVCLEYIYHKVIVQLQCAALSLRERERKKLFAFLLLLMDHLYYYYHLAHSMGVIQWKLKRKITQILWQYILIVFNFVVQYTLLYKIYIWLDLSAIFKLFVSYKTENGGLNKYFHLFLRMRKTSFDSIAILFYFSSPYWICLRVQTTEKFREWERGSHTTLSTVRIAEIKILFMKIF